MTMNNERKVIELEQGWAIMQKGITKLKNILEEEVPEQQFSSKEYIMLYMYFCFSLSLSLSSSSLGLTFILAKGFGFVASFDTRKFSISAVLLSLRGCGKRGSGRERNTWRQAGSMMGFGFLFIYFWLPILRAESFRDAHSLLIALAQDNLQYVYTEASARLLRTALRQI
jgi:hypothetical protein